MQNFENIYSKKIVKNIEKFNFNDENIFVLLVDFFIKTAIEFQASDIFFESLKEKFQIRFRIDGILYPITILSKQFEESLITRIKVISKLIIYKKRLPQEGRIINTDIYKNVDLRVSVIPALHGEKAVIRILYSQKLIIPIENLGLLENQLQVLKKIINRPEGLILFTGPAGSGKTTSIYSILKFLYNNTGNFKNICTIEDPVEVDLENISQTSIDNAIGFNFASALKSILRHDPDIIMLGEIRERKTALTTIEASLTGHLIIATIHSKSIAGVIIRLLNMEIEPYLIASSISAVITQRLIRKICNECTQEININIPAEIKEQGISKLFNGKGCEKCNYTGFFKREGIFEILEFDDELKEFILQKPSLTELENKIKQKTTLLFDIGLYKAKKGITSLEEIYRVC